ncbi:MAG: Glycerol-3-phosphate acyltransferase [Holosporales bacterium]
MFIEALHIMMCFLLAYGICAIPFGLIFAKLLNKEDLRTVGSGNIGATNALRTGGKTLGILTLIADLLKGYAVVCFVPYAMPIFFICNSAYLFLLGITCVLGHVFSYSPISFIRNVIHFCFFKKRIPIKKSGGKGVATAFGTLFALNQRASIILLASWLCSFLIIRISGISALVSFFLLPIFLVLFDIGTVNLKIYAVALSFIIFLTHTDNIKKYI